MGLRRPAWKKPQRLLFPAPSTSLCLGTGACSGRSLGGYVLAAPFGDDCLVDRPPALQNRQSGTPLHDVYHLIRRPCLAPRRVRFNTSLNRHHLEIGLNVRDACKRKRDPWWNLGLIADRL
jgi:hypothetical protein